MHRHALAARHVADDRFAADRIAALGAVDQQVVHALDLDDQVARCRRGRPERRKRGRGRRLLLLFLLQAHRVGRQLLEDLPRGELPVAERGVQVVHLREAVLGSDALEIRLADPGQLHAHAARFLLEVLLADLDGLGPLGGVDDGADLVARPRGPHQRQPVLARHVAGLGEDLDHVAVAQCVLQRDDAAVHLRADAGVADGGVDGVGEIDGRRIARQDDHLAARREGVDLLAVQVHLEGGHELVGVPHLLDPLQQVAQPGDALVLFAAGVLAAFLVLPVRGDALLGDAVHLLGADLHFEGLPVGAHHRGVQGLIQVGARNGDEVLDAPGNGPPLVVDDAQGGVAVLHAVGDDAHGQHVVDLLDRDLLPLQLLVDRVSALDAALDARRNAFAAQNHVHVILDLLEEILVGLAARFDGGDDLLVGRRVPGA